MAVLLETAGTRKKDLRKVLDEYLHLEEEDDWDVDGVSEENDDL